MYFDINTSYKVNIKLKRTTVKRILSIFMALAIVITIFTFVKPITSYAVASPKVLVGAKNHSLLLMDDGTVMGWGDNANGELGLGNYNSGVISPTTIPGLTNVKQIVGTNDASIALLNDGTVKVWGSNYFGSLGKSSPSYSLTPITLTGLSNVKELFAGDESIFAILNDGTVKAWGRNDSGQLGTGNKSNQFTPITISGLTGVSYISSGYYHTLFVMSDGTVKACGYNSTGELGFGTSSTYQLTPATVPGLTNVKKADAREYFSISLQNDGTLKAWGYNTDGRLGIGSTTAQYTPVTISGISNVKDIAAERNAVVALLNDGTLKAWGNNADGQLGIGSYTNQLSPVNITGLSNVSKIINNGVAHTFAVLNDGTINTWGYNGKGQLGIGNTTNQKTPVILSGYKIVASTPPIITIATYNTNPTNQNIVVTASTDKGTLNTTTHTFTNNGSFDFVATDATTGLITTKTVTITNIDKTAPVITIAPYNMNPTNTDLSVTASTSEGSLNATTHTFTANGNFDFIATDAAGNVTTKTVTITNIDKTAPTKPTITVVADQNKLNITSGTDNESGVNKTVYQLNNGSWIDYTGEVVLLDGTYTINAKTIDNAGNESTISTTNVVFYQTALTTATSAVVKAEGSKTQTDVDYARTLVNALMASDKTALNSRLDVIQSYIDAEVAYANQLSTATSAVTTAESTKTQNDVNSARALVNELRPSDRTTLSTRLDTVQDYIDSEVNLPTVPLNVSTTSTSNSITIVWDNVIGATEYDIELDGTVLDNGHLTSYIHKYLIADSQHSYRVRSKNIAGISEWSAVITARTLQNPPSVPQNIKLMSATNSIIVLWDAVPGPAAYDIEVDGVVIDNQMEMSYTHSSLIADSQHTYRIRAKNLVGISDWSPLTVGRTLQNPPAIPQHITATATANSITVIWNEVGTASGYDIEVDGKIVNNDSRTSFIHYILMSDTQHTYRVRAKNIVSVGEWSEPIRLYTQTATIGMEDVPENIAIAAASNSISIIWDGIQGVDGYDVEINGTVIANKMTVTNYVYNGLESNTEYTFRLRAVKGTTVCRWSPIQTIRTLNDTAGELNVPVNIGVTATSTEIAIAWDSVLGAERYDVEMDGIITGNMITVANYVYGGLMPDTVHVFRVRTVNALEMSEWSPVYTIRTQKGTTQKLNIPVNVSATSTSTEIAVVWDSVPRAERYDVEIDGITVGNNITVANYVYGGLVPDTVHVFRVRSVNALEMSEWSPSSAIRTQQKSAGELGIPVNVSATTSSNMIAIIWDKVPMAKGYDVEINGNIARENITVTNFVYGGLAPGSIYTFRVRSLNEESKSEWSSLNSITTMRNEEPILETPVNVNAIASSSSVTVIWDNVKAAMYYEIEINKSISQYKTTVANFTYAELSPNTSYSFRIRAVSGEKVSEWSSPINITTLLTEVGTNAVPTNLNATSTSTDLAIVWDSVKGAKSYDIEVDGVILARNITVSNFVYSGAASNTSYIVRVRAVSDMGISGWSSQKVTTTSSVYMIDCTENKSVNILFKAMDISNFDQYVFTVIYNPDQLDVIDLCNFTVHNDLSVGNIKGTDIVITEFKAGVIKFKLSKNIEDNQLWSGLLNSIKFVSKVNGYTKIIYKPEKT